MNAHVPIALLALAIAVFLGAQIGVVYRASDTVRWQIANLEKQEGDLKAAQKQVDDLVEQRAELVREADRIGQQYNALLNDVLELAREDPEVEAVARKWGIQRKATPPAAESPPAPEPAPNAGDAPVH
jgi:hypothetical protein